VRIEKGFSQSGIQIQKVLTSPKASPKEPKLDPEKLQVKKRKIKLSGLHKKKHLPKRTKDYLTLDSSDKEAIQRQDQYLRESLEARKLKKYQLPTESESSSEAGSNDFYSLESSQPTYDTEEQRKE